MARKSMTEKLIERYIYAKKKELDSKYDLDLSGVYEAGMAYAYQELLNDFGYWVACKEIKEGWCYKIAIYNESKNDYRRYCLDRLNKVGTHMLFRATELEWNEK